MHRLLLAVLLVLATPHAALPGFVLPLARPALAPRSPPAVCRLRAQVRLAAPDTPPTILTLPYAELCELVGERDARSAWNLYRIGADPAAAPDADAENARPASRKFTVSAAAREIISGMALPTLVRTEEVSVAKDGTTKLLLRLADGLAVETVLIPPPPQQQAGARSARAKTSLCVSSQVGCVRGCRFCATGAMGIVRNLSADEILATVVLSRREAAARALPSVDNIVFMGMGEPLDNPDAVFSAIASLTDSSRFDFSKAKVLLSTVAPSPEAIARLEEVECQLAWSVHAADDATRRALVPSTRHSMLELRDAFTQVLGGRHARGMRHSLMVEYVLLNGLNDSLQHARELAEFLLPLHAVTQRRTEDARRGEEEESGEGGGGEREEDESREEREEEEERGAARKESTATRVLLSSSSSEAKRRAEADAQRERERKARAQRRGRSAAKSESEEEEEERKRGRRTRTGLLVNLIPFNEAPDGGLRGFNPPPRQRVQAFQAELRRRGVWASVRVQRGDDENAACGMLVTRRSEHEHAR